MFSLRLFALTFAVATVAALPTTDKPIPRAVTTITDSDIEKAPWFSLPLFDNLFSPIWRLFPTFADIGPKIVADDKKFEVVVNVKDYKKDELKVKVKGDFIFVQGTHETKQDDRDIFASQFYHTYSLPVNSSAADVTAELSTDGYLIVTVPLSEQPENAKEADREVPIVESNAPYLKEEATTTAQPTTVTEDDRKEPTTPSEREEATEKDNVIPHGNEIPL